MSVYPGNDIHRGPETWRKASHTDEKRTFQKTEHPRSGAETEQDEDVRSSQGRDEHERQRRASRFVDYLSRPARGKEG